VTVTPDAANYFTVSGAAAQVAGTANALTIRAYDLYGNLCDRGVNNYTGDKAITFGGASTIGVFVPTVTDKLGVATDLGIATTITFTNGVSTAGGSMVLYKVETANITATQGAINTPAPLAVTVTPAGIGYFTVTGIPAVVTADDLLSPVITAFDPFGNIETGYTGTITFSSDNGDPALPADYTFTSGPGQDNGVHTFAGGAQLKRVSAGCYVAVADGLKTGQQAGIVVNPGLAAQLLWVTQPPVSVTVGAAWTDFSIEITDAYGNRRTADTDNVTVTPSFGALTGPTTVAAVGGLATFSGISFSSAGTLTLTGSAAGLIPTPPSNLITVNALPPSGLPDENAILEAIRDEDLTGRKEYDNLINITMIVKQYGMIFISVRLDENYGFDEHVIELIIREDGSYVLGEYADMRYKLQL
jgi:hypothetical protein